MLLVFLFVISSQVFAEVPRKPLPLWEVGAGVLPFRADNYRGSPQHKWFLFPLPAVTIRGKNVESENGFIRGHIKKFGNLTVDLSFNLGLNVSGGGDHLRRGMDGLDPTFEIGPMIRYYMWKSKNGNHFLNLEAPYRAVYATDLSYIDHVGYYSIPYLNFLSRPSEETFGWSSEISLGPQYGSSGFHNRFYAVNTKDVTPDRRYYHSRSGYSGTQFSWALSKRMENFLLIPFFRYDYLDGAVYRKSDLYKNPHYTMFGAAIVWFFAASDKKQEAPTMVK